MSGRWRPKGFAEQIGMCIGEGRKGNISTKVTADVRDNSITSQTLVGVDPIGKFRNGIVLKKGNLAAFRGIGLSAQDLVSISIVEIEGKTAAVLGNPPTGGCISWTLRHRG